MINNKGAIISVCKIDGKLYKQLYVKKSLYIIAALMTFAVAGAVLEIIFGKLSSAYDIIIFVCFCVLFCLGGFLLVISLVAVKKISLSQQSCECEIYKDCIMVSLFDKGEKCGEAKFDYKNLFKSLEIKDYFIAYKNQNVFYPISKEGLTPEEQNAVRTLLGLRSLQGAGTADVAETSDFAENGGNNDGSDINDN